MNYATRPRNTQSGFTLVELIVVIVIMGIVMAIAAPSFNTLVLNQRVRTGAADVQASLFFARSEALKRGANIDVAPIGGNWQSGWMVQISGGGTTLRRETAFGSKLNVTQSPAATITYRRDGRITAGVAPSIIVSIAGSAVPARCVEVDLTGRPRVVLDTDGNPANGCN
jgi:type IV fimbrial biogenesis protein FimT